MGDREFSTKELEYFLPCISGSGRLVAASLVAEKAVIGWVAKNLVGDLVGC
jgi:hypothetical protein